MNSNFFTGNHFFIDEKVQYFNFENIYKVYNENGENIGSINQKLTFGQKMLRLFVNKKMLPFKLEIVDSNDVLQASISRGWTFWLSKITLTDYNNSIVGTIKQKFSFFKSNFKINDASDMLIAEINGDWAAWDFKIMGADHKQLGTISKKWNGIVKEVFTDADKYIVSLNNDMKDRNKKVAIVAAAITIDMVLKENK